MKIERQRRILFKFREAGLHARGSHGLGSLKAALNNETLHLSWVSFVLDVTTAPVDGASECSGSPRRRDRDQWLYRKFLQWHCLNSPVHQLALVT